MPLEDLVAEAYVYGYPLVYDIDEVQRFRTEGMGTTPPSEFNLFAHSSQLAGPGDRFVSINNDTVYSIAQIDAGGGPVELSVPATAGRYYVLQFVDAWTNNFAYIGKRATGTGEGSYLLIPPGSDTAAPAGATAIHLPTNVVSIVGRWACAGTDDLPNVAALQQKLTLRQTAPGNGIPEPRPVADDLAFFEKLRVLVHAFPPAAPDRQYQERFAPLGLLEQTSPYQTPAPELAAALRTGAATGQQRIDYATTHGPSTEQNGWRLTYHAFDYNQDYFQIGTINDPQWVDQDRTKSYLVRAAAARAGLWGNHGYEAAYAMTWNDGNGDQLNGHHSYTITFAHTPPVDAFWSITMYDLPDYYLVTNPIGRYSIGDRTPGLTRNPDGTLTITLSHTPPTGTTNWLPAPEGDFRPILRMYQPRPAVLDGTYTLPPIHRLPD